MIVTSPHSSSPGSLLRAFTLVLAALLLAGVPSTAAATGGVAVPSSPSAKAASAATDGTGDADTGDTTAASTAAPAVTALDRKPVNRAQVRRAQTLLRLSATGKHDDRTRRVVKRFQRLRGLAMSGVVNLSTYIEVKNAFALLETGGASSADVTATPTTDGGGASVLDTPAEPSFPANLAPITATERSILDKISSCESKSDPRAVSSNGLYRGKYQFDTATWKSVGGAGKPDAASGAEQDQRAAILLRQRGTAPWPICGR